MGQRQPRLTLPEGSRLPIHGRNEGVPSTGPSTPWGSQGQGGAGDHNWGGVRERGQCRLVSGQGLDGRAGWGHPGGGNRPPTHHNAMEGRTPSAPKEDFKLKIGAFRKYRNVWWGGEWSDPLPTKTGMGGWSTLPTHHPWDCGDSCPAPVSRAAIQGGGGLGGIRHWSGPDAGVGGCRSL